MRKPNFPSIVRGTGDSIKLKVQRRNNEFLVDFIKRAARAANKKSSFFESKQLSQVAHTQAGTNSAAYLPNSDLLETNRAYAVI